MEGSASFFYKVIHYDHGMNVNSSFSINEIVSGWLRDLAVAGTFLTRLPFRPSSPLGLRELSRAVRVFPIIGLIVGIVGGAAIMIAALVQVNPVIYGMIGLAAVTLVTGALHEDGLADFMDGIGAPDRLRRLEIMRDPNIGTYGVLALIFALGLKVALLSVFSTPNLAIAALIAAAAISRGMMPLLMYIMKPAQPDGLAHDAGRPSLSRAGTALLMSAISGFIILGLWSAVFALFLSMVATLLIGLLAQRLLAGYTGDVLGAAQQCAEITVLIVAGANAL